MAFNANVRSASTSSGSESIGRATRQAQHIAGNLPDQNSQRDEQQYLPEGLVEGCKLKRDIKRDAVLTYTRLRIRPAAGRAITACQG
jgi:predicted homoserine dehydrogenase-like protein